jgi:hypothetical protein
MMESVQKAMESAQKALDTVVGANLLRQDLSDTISILQGRPRPFLQNCPNKAKATQIVHEWNEQGLIGPGNGVASYADGTLPTADAQASVQRSNVTCRVGKTAAVTDDMIASYTRGYTVVLAPGELERLAQSAIDYQCELKTIEVLDECEWMHISGNAQVTSGFAGGQCQGLSNWIINNGVVFTPTVGGTTATAGAPAAFQENFIKQLLVNIASNFPSAFPTDVLIPPELKPDFNSFTGSGAGNPIVRVIDTSSPTLDLIAGSPEVTKYDTGFGVIDVRIEPNLSPLFNPLLSGNAYVTPLFYNRMLVDNAPLRPIGAETLARISTTLQRMITTTFTQEHRIPLHAGAIQYVKSAIDALA